MSLANFGPFAILISALGAWIFAWLAIDTNRKVNRRKAALDYFNRAIWDKDFIDARKMFLAEIKKDGGLLNWADVRHISSPQLTAIDNIFQHYELIAIGIKNDTLDEQVCKQWCRGSLIRDWKNSESCVKKIREISGNPKIYLEFEMLALRWSD